jgi:hypothetical protein
VGLLPDLVGDCSVLQEWADAPVVGEHMQSVKPSRDGLGCVWTATFPDSDSSPSAARVGNEYGTLQHRI